MKLALAAACITLAVASQQAVADASYQVTHQISGGTFADKLKTDPFASHFTKDLFAPKSALTMVHGNQKAVVSNSSTDITDLDQETVTHIDTAHKTYTVMSFAQMRENMVKMGKQMERMNARQQEQAPSRPAQNPNLKVTFDTAVKDAGVTREINGVSAQQYFVVMKVHVLDATAPDHAQDANAPTYELTTELWLAPEPPEVREIRAFDARMAAKLMAGVDMSAFERTPMGNPGLGAMFGTQPGATEAMEKMGKELLKLKGTHIREIQRMGGYGGPGGPVAPDSTASASPEAQLVQGAAGHLGGLGSLLGSGLGSLMGGNAAPPAPPHPPAAAAGATGTIAFEMIEDMSEFSIERIPAGAFLVPAGFTKVEPRTSFPGASQ